MRGATCPTRRRRSAYEYFNPRAPCGARRETSARSRSGACHFNPRAPCGARQRPPLVQTSPSAFQSTRPLRGATGSPCPRRGEEKISIHAPLAGRDWRYVHFAQTRVIFQSTRPLRGATDTLAALMGGAMYFNPRAPCGARRRDLICYQPWIHISIHAPLAGRDRFLSSSISTGETFQSTRPLRGATTSIDGKGGRIKISIHAPLAGRDCSATPILPHQLYFNPRAPCGARHALSLIPWSAIQFQSTRPLRGATGLCASCASSSHISIHAPLAGRDLA